MTAVIHTVTEQVTIRAPQCRFIDPHRRRTDDVLVDEHGRDYLLCVQFLQARNNRRQRMTHVQDVIDQQHRASGNFPARSDEPGQGATARCVVVAGGMNVLHLEREMQAQQQLRSQYQAAVHHTHHDRM